MLDLFVIMDVLLWIAFGLSLLLIALPFVKFLFFPAKPRINQKIIWHCATCGQGGTLYYREITYRETAASDVERAHRSVSPYCHGNPHEGARVLDMTGDEIVKLHRKARGG
jgi:hypothetical protein